MVCHSKDLSSLELFGSRKKFSKQAENVEVEEWEDWFMNVSVSQSLWFHLADFSSQEKKGQGHWQ